MFSKFSMNRYVNSSYVPIPSSRDLFIHLVHPSEEDGDGSDVSFRDLLSGADREDAASMFLFETTGYGLFVLWTCRAGSTSTSTNSFDDALLMSQEFIKRTRQRQICISFKPEEVKLREMSDRASSTNLVILARYDQALASSLGIPLVQQHKIARANKIAKGAGLRRSFFHSLDHITPDPLSSSQLLYTSGIIACFLVLIFSAKYLMASSSPDKYHVWMAYNTHGSVGPKYELSLTGQNVSSWTSSPIHNNSEWALRIDDQALIPLSLMDDEEQHYQEWYQTHYPEINQIRLNHDYLNDTWLSSPAIDQVPVDDLFHFSHCVLALKRYVKAKETGEHVCGRDIDHDHIGHCLDALDWWAFPSKRTEMTANPKRPFGWRTKVCFD